MTDQAALSVPQSRSAVAQRRRRLRRGWYVPYLFLAPAFLWYLAFLVYPMLVSLYVSFFEWDGLSATMNFVGLRNYIDIFIRDEVSRLALWNNILWTLASLVI